MGLPIFCLAPRSQPLKMLCDTLSDVPPHIRTKQFVLRVLDDLKLMRGLVVSGRASALYCKGEGWGASVPLSEDESVCMRVYPQGTLNNRTISGDDVVLVAVRTETAGVGDANVSFAVLWTPVRGVGIDPSELNRGAGKTSSTRYLSLIAPSLFHHHDATFSDDRLPAYPILDEKNHHSVKPSCFTLTTPVEVDGDRKVVTSCGTGHSVFVLAGAFAGVEVADAPCRAAEVVSHGEWNRRQHAMSKLLEKKSPKKAFGGLVSAMLLSDLCSIEGIVSVLCLGFVEGVLPDSFHSPAMLPLLVAVCLRLACKPERFGLAKQSEEDAAAAKLFSSMFSSEWPELSDGGFAIDRLIEAAVEDAKAGGDQRIASRAVADHLVYFFRAGTFFLYSVFGEDKLSARAAPTSAFGSTEAIEARRLTPPARPAPL